MSDTNGFRTTYASLNIFLEMTVRESREKAKKPICIIKLGLPLPGSLSLCTLEAQEVTTKGVYRLLHAIY